MDGEGGALAMPARNDFAIWLEIEAEVQQQDSSLALGYALYADDGNLLYWSFCTDKPEPGWTPLAPGRHRLRTRIPSHLLNEGTYRIELIGGLHFEEWFFEPGTNTPHVHLTIKGGLSDSPQWTSRRPGLLAPVIAWERDKTTG